MISTRYQFIFLHVPKTGGNSVQKTLLPLSDDQMVLHPWQDGRDRFEISGPITPHKHALLADYEAHNVELTRTHAVMIGVRHPFDRALSAYFSPHFWLGQTDPKWDETAFYDLIKKPILTPASDFLKINTGYRQPDIVLHFERLANDFSLAVRQLGLPKTIGAELQHLNRSAAPNGVRQKLRASKTLGNFVESHFSEDMERFGY